MNLREKMENFEFKSLGPLPRDSPYIKTLRMLYKHNGKERFWDFSSGHNSVSVVLFNTSRNVLIFVKQFRPAVFYNMVLDLNKGKPVECIEWNKFPAKLGFTLELCAGIVDKPELTVKEIVKEEVLEECGYDVPLENFQLLASFRSSVGDGGSGASMFFAEITDNMKINTGGGLVEEGELIEVIEMTVPDVREYMGQESVLSPAGFLFGVTWFLMNKLPTYCL